jgi:hypothetical protein
MLEHKFNYPFYHPNPQYEWKYKQKHYECQDTNHDALSLSQ